MYYSKADCIAIVAKRKSHPCCSLLPAVVENKSAGAARGSNASRVPPARFGARLSLLAAYRVQPPRPSARECRFIAIYRRLAGGARSSLAEQTASHRGDAVGRREMGNLRLRRSNSIATMWTF